MHVRRYLHKGHGRLTCAPSLRVQPSSKKTISIDRSPNAAGVRGGRVACGVRGLNLPPAVCIGERHPTGVTLRMPSHNPSLPLTSRHRNAHASSSCAQETEGKRASEQASKQRSEATKDQSDF